MIALEPIDRALLDGVHGPAAAQAMAMLVRYGEACNARRFIAIESAHIDGCLYHGPSSIDFARRFVDLGGQVRVPTTLNVGAVDALHPEWNCVSAGLVDAQNELTRLHEQLGCVPTLTCAPYQRLFRPRFGEHVAWAESNAIVFVNSVLGARTDRYGDFTDLCAALTGRVPLTGMHCEENRQPRLVVDAVPIERTSLPRDLYFAAVGYVLGARADGEVPLLHGLPVDTNEDELKALGAAGASSGAIALFHAAGITPEADWAIQHAKGLPRSDIEARDLEAALALLCPVETGDRVSAVCLGTPHYSLAEFAALNQALTAFAPPFQCPVFVSTSREIAAAVTADPGLPALRGFDIRIVVDTCTYVAPMVRDQQGAILTTSGKYAHYGPGNLKRRVGLMTLERCLRSAALGRIA